MTDPQRHEAETEADAFEELYGLSDELVDAVKQIHDMFWATKNREVAWNLAG